jgi:hypothetical protein
METTQMNAARKLSMGKSRRALIKLTRIELLDKQNAISLALDRAFESCDAANISRLAI